MALPLDGPPGPRRRAVCVGPAVEAPPSTAAQADKGRACLSEASLRGPRLTRAPQVARSEAEGHAQWGRLSLVTFFGETKKVTRPPGRIPGSGL